MDQKVSYISVIAEMFKKTYKKYVNERVTETSANTCTFILVLFIANIVYFSNISWINELN